METIEYSSDSSSESSDSSNTSSSDEQELVVGSARKQKIAVVNKDAPDRLSSLKEPPTSLSTSAYPNTDPPSNQFAPSSPHDVPPVPPVPPVPLFPLYQLRTQVRPLPRYFTDCLPAFLNILLLSKYIPQYSLSSFLSNSLLRLPHQPKNNNLHCLQFHQSTCLRNYYPIVLKTYRIHLR